MPRLMFTLVALLCFLLPLAAQNPAGGDADSRLRPDSGLHSRDWVQLLDEIGERLQLLESDYLPRLEEPRQTEALELIDELFALVEEAYYAFPEFEQEGHPRPMDRKSFAELKGSLKKQAFPDDQLKLLQTVVEDNQFSAEQISGLLGLLFYPDDKLDALRLLFPVCIDKGGKFRIVDAFFYDSDKEAALKIMGKDGE